MSKPEINSYRDLLVWRQAMDLAVLCYSLMRTFPREDAFGLTSQIRRASASIAANIAEGHGREHPGSFVQFLRVAQGSLKETETHLLLSERVGLLKSEQLATAMDACTEIGKMLRALIRSLQVKQ